MKVRVSVFPFVFLFLACAVLIRTTRLSANAAKASLNERSAVAVNAFGRLPLYFEGNRGQTDPQVKFVARGSGYTLFLTRGEAVLALRKSAPQRDPVKPASLVSMPATLNPDAAEPPAIVRMKLVGANTKPRVEGLDELPGKANYFIGNDPKKWRTNVPMYAKVRYREVYPGVDLVYYGNQRQLEHDFIVAPGVDPGTITMDVEGAERLSLDAQGDLVLAMKDGEVRFQKPVVYQQVEGARREVFGSYRFKNGRQVGFQVAAHDGRLPLVIDPMLSYSTYLGGSGFDQGRSIALDSSGSAYVTGYINSNDFPTVNPISGACKGTCGGPEKLSDAFVTKLNAAGSALDYSTYLGGSGYDYGQGIAVDSSGSAYVTGATNSNDFPTVNPISGACKGTCGTGSDYDAFVTKLNAAGSALDYSTYLGGSGADQGFGIALDSSGSAYVTGATNSNDFPTVNPISEACKGTCGTGGPGNSDAFVTKLNAAGSALDYSTYLGGSGADQGFGIAVDSSGSAYVTGATNSNDFPTVNPISGACKGTCGTPNPQYVYSDAFVTKLNAAGSALDYSTYLGGSGADAGLGIAADSVGDAYVTGATTSNDFPTVNPISEACKGACGTGSDDDAFVTKIANIVCTTEDDDERGDREQRDHKHRDHKHRDHKHKGKIHPCKEVESEQRDSEKE